MHQKVIFVIKKCLPSALTYANNANTMKKPLRYTITLPPELDRGLSDICTETGVALADLLRQGGIRILLEKREKGEVALMTMPKCPKVAA